MGRYRYLEIYSHQEDPNGAVNHGAAGGKQVDPVSAVRYAPLDVHDRPRRRLRGRVRRRRRSGRFFVTNRRAPTLDSLANQPIVLGETTPVAVDPTP